VHPLAVILVWIRLSSRRDLAVGSIAAESTAHQQRVASASSL